MELVSVIVPIYNVELYLRRCVNSLLNQSYKNIEIILVDDGSTDNCAKICDEYSAKDERIAVYHKRNGGLSDARNFGIERCKGDYITFVDSDDYVAENYIELLLENIQAQDADISICGSQYVFDESHIQEEVKESQLYVYTAYEAIIESLNNRIKQRAWGKLYKRYLFDSIRFPIRKLYEDLAVVYDLLLLSHKVVFSDAPAYYYLIRSGSIMQSSFNMKQAIEIDIIDEAMDKVVAKYPELENLTNARRIYSYFVVLRRILTSDNPDEYLNIRKEIKNRIQIRSRHLLKDNRVNRNTKIKILSYKFGEKAYLACQRLADKRNPEVRS